MDWYLRHPSAFNSQNIYHKQVKAIIQLIAFIIFYEI